MGDQEFWAGPAARLLAALGCAAVTGAAAASGVAAAVAAGAMAAPPKRVGLSTLLTKLDVRPSAAGQWRTLPREGRGPRVQLASAVHIGRV
jgi:hypothetical protein